MFIFYGNVNVGFYKEVGSIDVCFMVEEKMGWFNLVSGNCV